MNRDRFGRFVKGHRLPGPGGVSSYRQDVADAVIAWVSAGKSLKSFCEQHPGVPDRASIQRWSIKDVDGFRARFREARELGAEAWADDIIELSDQSRCAAGDMALMQSYKLSVDSRKWLASKLLPQYGEAVQHQLSGAAINIYLPEKGSHASKMIEGEAVELIERGTGPEGRTKGGE
jgi:hypothetical protein